MALLTTTLIAAVLAGPVHDSHLPDGFELVQLPGYYGIPTGFVFAPDGALVLVEKWGAVRYRPDGGPPQAAPLLDLAHEVNAYGDRGILSVALHPGWAPDGGPRSWLYVLYSVTPVPGQDPPAGQDDQYSFARLTRYRVETALGDVRADTGSRQVLLGHQLADGTAGDAIATLQDVHQSGSLVFGTDGSLLVATGDGASASEIDTGGGADPGFDTFVHPLTGLKGPIPKQQDSGALRAQDLRSLCGKVLRIDPETGEGYGSNPFFDGDLGSNASRVFALGLRMPFRMGLDPVGGSVDPADGRPGRLWVGDVGWGTWEELDRCEGGENFGWPCWEGPAQNAPYASWGAPQSPYAFPDCGQAPAGVLTPPAVAWHHVDPAALVGAQHLDGGAPGPGFAGECAIGGPRYPGGSYPVEYVGRLFAADFVEGWVRTVEVDAAGYATAVHDFAHDLGPLVDMQVHPATGDVHLLTLNEGEGALLSRLRYGADLSPVAVATGTPTSGDGPLLVSFDGAGSTDPDGQPLEYEWDFGDGSPLAQGAAPQHVYDADGVFIATLTVTDAGDQSDTDTLVISVGDVAPQPVLIHPLPNQAYVPGDVIPLVGAGVDPQQGALTYRWTVDMIHDTHLHPGHLVADGPVAALTTEDHGSPGDLTYYRIELEVSDGQAFTGKTHVYVYPADHLHDPTGTARAVARVFELDPPYPMGGGSPDIEVLRDGVWPAPAPYVTTQQFDTFHLGAQLGDDWLGWEWAQPFAPATVFVGVLYQEGLHYPAGGWWETLDVEVRHAGVWTPVEGLRISPEYPFELATTPFFDATVFDVYSLSFDPVHGDAIRLHGDPGGVLDFTSAAELRALVARPMPLSAAYDDLTPAGTFAARVLELDPPGPQGAGNHDPQTLRNGTWVWEGSDSLHAQFDAEHGGEQVALDWMGWDFDGPRSFARVRFQEGLHQPHGGWLQDIAVEVRSGGVWGPVSGLLVDPPYVASGAASSSYRTFELRFDPIVGDAVRVAGVPGGASAFMSAGELRVDAPGWADPVCGAEVLGADLGGVHLLELETQVQAITGRTFGVRVSGSLPGALAALAIAEGAAELPLYAGTVLVDPAQLAALTLMQFDALGQLVWTTEIPGGAGFDHHEWFLQAFAADPGAPYGLRLSNGLAVTSCSWSAP